MIHGSLLGEAAYKQKHLFLLWEKSLREGISVKNCEDLRIFFWKFLLNEFRSVSY